MSSVLAGKTSAQRETGKGHIKFELKEILQVKFRALGKFLHF